MFSGSKRPATKARPKIRHAIIAAAIVPLLASSPVLAQIEGNVLKSRPNNASVIKVRENPGFKRDLAATPPMGWNSWNTFRCEYINEAVVRETADVLVSSGMKDAGYQYVVIDDCWQVGRDADGRLIADPKAFPSGMKALGDYVHSKGLKFGIYSAATPHTCAGRPASKGYEWTDAKAFADWGVDYLKYDWCDPDWDFQSPIDSYVRMRDALVDTKRDIVFSICEHGRSDPWRWGTGVGHLWRVFKDIRPCFNCTGHKATNGILQILDQMEKNQTWRFSGKGAWNDPDSLEVGNPGMNDVEAQTHFGLWAVLASPLIAGNDIRSMSAKTREILTNKEVIAVNQDGRGKEGYLFRDYFNGTQIWRKPMKPGKDGRNRDAIFLLNRSDEAKTIAFNPEPETDLRDLYAHKDLGRFASGHFEAKVPARGSLLLMATGITKSD